MSAAGRSHEKAYGPQKKQNKHTTQNVPPESGIFTLNPKEDDMSAIVRKRIETTYKITTDETLYSMTTREEFTPVAGTVTEYFLATDDGGQRKRLDVSLDNGRHGEDDDGWLMTAYIGRSPEFLPDIAQELIFQHYQAVDSDA